MCSSVTLKNARQIFAKASYVKKREMRIPAEDAFAIDL